MLSQTKIDQNRFILSLTDCFYHDVFQFDVPVHDPSIMQKFDHLANFLHNRFENCNKLERRIKPGYLHKLKKIHFKNIHNDVDEALGVVNAIKLTNVGVIHAEWDQKLPL